MEETTELRAWQIASLLCKENTPLCVHRGSPTLVHQKGRILASTWLLRQNDFMQSRGKLGTCPFQCSPSLTLWSVIGAAGWPPASSLHIRLWHLHTQGTNQVLQGLLPASLCFLGWAEMLLLPVMEGISQQVSLSVLRHCSIHLFK